MYKKSSLLFIVILLIIFSSCSSQNEVKEDNKTSKMTSAEHLQAAKEALAKGDTITANTQLSFIKNDSNEYPEAQMLQKEVDKKRKEYQQDDLKRSSGKILTTKKSRKEKEIDELAEIIKENIGKDISMEMYNKIKMRMTYIDVVKITGRNGTELSTVDITGYRTVMMMWQNNDGSNMNVMFQNGKVISKAQFGLR